MPFCHIELEKSDYLIERVDKGGSSALATAGLGVDQAKIRVLEFAVCGVGVVSTRSEAGNTVCMHVAFRKYSNSI